jgi:hypothetical protein
MAQYIDKSVLVAEIEKRKQRNHKNALPKVVVHIMKMDSY